MGKNEQVNYSQSIRVSNSQSTSQVDNSQSACQVDNSQSTRVDNSQSTARLGNSQSTQVYNSQSTSQLDNGQSTRVNNSQSTSQVDKSQSTVVQNSQFTSQVENSQSTQVDNNQPTSQVCPEMDKLAEEAVAYCQENNISNPSEILRVIQNKFVKGRNLEVQRVEEVSEGMTQYILVNRKSILETAFEELKEVALSDLQKTLQVDFYGEVCKYHIQLFRYMVLDIIYKSVKACIKEPLVFKVRLKWWESGQSWFLTGS